MKIKNLLSMLVLIAWITLLPAQITRERADEIVYKYITDEKLRTDYLLLYTTDKLPNTEGISTITNYNNETFSIEYPCWVYYVNEWYDVNGPYFRRYLFVNKNTGNILEVKTRDDFGPEDPKFENWQLIYSAFSGLSNLDNELGVFHFSNTVSDFLEITYEKDFEHIEIFDLQGKQVFQGTFKQNESIQRFDVSSLHQGLHIVKIFDATKNVLTFKILKM